jgi:hypothetical protein
MRKTSTNRAKGKKNRPKTKLGIPDLEHSIASVPRSLSSPDSRRGYQRAIDEFVAWYCSGDRVRDSAMIREASSSRSSFFWGMSQCKLRNAILAANSG